MSVEAMAWALGVPIGGNAKVVLLGLANHAHADFSEARPSVPTLATYACCDDRTVQRHLRKLEEDGWIAQTGWYAVDGRPDRMVAVYRLAGRQVVAPPQSGVTAVSERGDSGDASGVTLLSPEPSVNRPENRPKREGGGIAEVWEHYQAARKRLNPRSTGCRLGDVEKRLIRNALGVRSVEDCMAAIDGLFRSDYHVQHGYIGIKYALLGGGRSPDPGTTIDRLANGRGSGGRLKDKTYRGRSWDELTEREQVNVRESASMGLEVWDGGADAWADRVTSAPVLAHSPAGAGSRAVDCAPAEGLTAETF